MEYFMQLGEELQRTQCGDAVEAPPQARQSDAGGTGTDTPPPIASESDVEDEIRVSSAPTTTQLIQVFPKETISIDNTQTSVEA